MQSGLGSRVLIRMVLDLRIAGAQLILFVCVAGSAWGQPPEIECRRVAEDEPIRVDGSLADPAWQTAAWYGDFVQSVPDFGQPATEPTRVAFLLDDRNLYVGVRCDDSAPELIRAQKLRHRDEPETDDHVQIVFDTYRDQVRGTVFVVNPLGAKEEGLVNGFTRYNWNWNDVWQVKTLVTDTGWQAEFRIPLRLLRYRAAREQEWGVNVKRVVRRTQEETYLTAVSPPYDISSLNFAAVLTGLELGKRQRNLQFIPYALGGVLQETVPGTGEQASSSIGEVGLDVKYSITSYLTLDGTYNTDFAQVENDDEQVNLTRFSLFFPEKREFFLEGAELFSFGHSGGPPGGPPDIAPFFSRRVGLHEGRTVPIDAGVRLTGKLGRQDIGFLSVRTGGLAELDLDPAWYHIARVRRELSGRSYIGGILTDSRQDGFRSTTIGVDGRWYFTNDLYLGGDFLRVDDNAAEGDANAYNLGLDLTTDPWGFLFEFREVGEGFDPDLGFVRRDGYRKMTGTLRRSFRPGRWGVRRVSVRALGIRYDSLEYDVEESGHSELILTLELENGDLAEVRTSRKFERLFEPFEVDDELTFDVGDYAFYSTSFIYFSDRSRRWGIDARLTTGEFYDGHRNQLTGDLWFVFNRHFRAAGSYSTYDISTSHGNIDWRLWSLRLSYTHSATLSASAFLQYNSSTSASLLNLRLRWILPNDSDLFLVINERRDEEFGVPADRDREAAVKVAYRFFL
jgi:hypothetical protein